MNLVLLVMCVIYINFDSIIFSSCRDPFKDFELFPSLDPLFYQGSKLTTCTEVETVFQRAIKRQRRFNEAGLPISCGMYSGISRLVVLL